MNKLISTVILTAFTAVCSFSAAAGSDDSDKNKGTMTSPSSSEKTSKKERDKSGKEPHSTSDIISREKMPDTERSDEYRDQEVMNKKPYKQ